MQFSFSKTVHLCALGILLLGFNSSARAQTFADIPAYSGDVHMLVKGQPQMTGKVYKGTAGIRMDLKHDQMTQTQIMRTDKNVAWSVMKEMGVYMEMPLQFNAMTEAKWDNVKQQCVGTEVFDGHPTQKCNIEVVNDGKTMKATIWKAQDLKGAVIKNMDEATQTGMEIRNIKVGPQPETLFSEPVGLKKIQMTAGVADMMKAISGAKTK